MDVKDDNTWPDLRYIAMPTETANALRAGAVDANGNLPERMISDGGGYPCRHCLCDIPEGRPMLLVSWRPFEQNHPYVETGPVFVCEDPCGRHDEKAGMPQVISVRPRFMLRGYDKDERIVEGSGSMVETPELERRAHELLQEHGIASVHVRSGTNTCFTCRIESRR